MSKLINAERTKLVPLAALQLERKLRPLLRRGKSFNKIAQAHSIFNFDDRNLFHTKIVIDFAGSATTLFTSTVRNDTCELD